MAFKVKILLLIFFSLLIQSFCFALSSESEKSLIHRLLRQVGENSFELKILEQTNLSRKLSLDANLALFLSTSYISGNYSHENIVSTSPFSASKAKATTYELGVEKLWESGLRSSISYNYLNAQTSYSGRENISYHSPTLNLSLSISLFQDLIFNRYGYFVDYQKNSLKWENLSSKIERKAVMVKSLLDFAQLLEQQESLSLQVEICRQTRTQSRNLKLKRGRGTVSEREYLLGLKELTNCLATTESLEKTMWESQEGFEATYHISFADYKGVSIDKLFDETKKIYQKSSFHFSEMKMDLLDEIKEIDLKMNSLKSKQGELEAQTKSDLALEIRSGLKGIGDDFSPSNRELFKKEYPYIYLGFKLNFPLQNREALLKSGANRYQLQATRYRRELLFHQKKNRIKTLQKTLKTDFSIYNKYKEAVRLSQSVLREGRKDFRNGRLDFNSLTELKKGLIQDQKNLSSYRVQLIIRVVEFLDFYQFFDRYLA